jgi:hypothetical protein
MLRDSQRVADPGRLAYPSLAWTSRAAEVISPHCKRKFTEDEDALLLHLVSIHGAHDWKTIAWHMSGRTVRQCRERFKYYLHPGIERRPWTPDEDRLLLDRYDAMGPRWAQLALQFDGRTDIDIKNRYHRIRRGMERPADEISTDDVMPVDDLATDDSTPCRPRLPSLSPAADILLPVAQMQLTSPPRPRRVICLAVNDQKLTQADQ